MLETKIDELTSAIKLLIEVMSEERIANTVVHVEQEKPPIMVVPPAPVQEVAPVANPTMPPLPSFAPPAPVVLNLPFNDNAGLINYAMAAYQQMGPVKGAAMQQLIESFGYTNMTAVKPEHFAAMYEGIEKMKVSG